LERINTIYDIIVTRDGANITPWSRAYVRLAAALHNAAWVYTDNANHATELFANLYQLNDHKGDLECYWISAPTQRQWAVMNWAWERVHEANTRHYIGTFGGKHEEFLPSDKPVCVVLGLPREP